MTLLSSRPGFRFGCFHTRPSVRSRARRRGATGALVGLLATLGATAASAQSFQRLGFLPGQTDSIAHAVSADGKTVAGWCGTGQIWLAQRAFRWTKAEGMKGLGTLPGGDAANATGVSADGSVIVGASTSATTIADDNFFFEGFRWTKTGGMKSLGFPVNTAYRNSGANGVSADGAAIVGSAFDENGAPGAYRWTLTGGFTVIAETWTGWAISADGAVIAGGDGVSAFRWSAQNGLDVIDPDNAIGVSVAYGMSPDGKRLAGEDAYVWSEADGFTFLHSLPGGESVSWGLSLSNAGVVAGWSSVGYNADGA